jgi:hypothetical protein
VTTIEPRLDVLPPAQQRLWVEFRELPSHFVLYGGTALTLRVGGRQSEDFDLFTNEPVDAHALGASLALLRGAELIQAAPATFLVDRDGRVKVSFFGALVFGRVGEPSVSRDNGLRLASLLDLAVQKMRVVQVRAAGKDYLDVETLLSNGVPLSRALGAAATLFSGFAPMVTLKALSYFEDGDLAELPEATMRALARAAADVRVIEPVPLLATRLTEL